MRTPTRVAGVVLTLTLASVACGLAVVGATGTDVDGGPNGGSSTSSSSGGADGALIIDDASSDAIDDAIFGDGSACKKAKPASATAASSAFHAAIPPNIDGDLGEWPCSAFTELNEKSAGMTRGVATNAAVRFAIAWDAAGVYFAMQVIDTLPLLGVDPVNPYENDACELYLAGDLPVDGAYTLNDMHLVVDYRGLVRSYTPKTGGGAPPVGVKTRTALTSDGYVVEGFVSRDLIGASAATMVSGKSFGFDIQLDDNSGGIPQSSVLWLYQNTAINCGECNCPTNYEPSCDNLMWGSLRLDP